MNKKDIIKQLEDKNISLEEHKVFKLLDLHTGSYLEDHNGQVCFDNLGLVMEAITGKNQSSQLYDIKPDCEAQEVKKTRRYKRRRKYNFTPNLIKSDIININDLIELIKRKKTKWAWDRGVKDYALDILSRKENKQININELESSLLLGTRDWKQYGELGYALLKNTDIAKRLCSTRELRANKFGALAPNENETWQEVQVKALEQAYKLIISFI